MGKGADDLQGAGRRLGTRLGYSPDRGLRGVRRAPRGVQTRVVRRGALRTVEQRLLALTALDQPVDLHDVGLGSAVGTETAGVGFDDWRSHIGHLLQLHAERIPGVRWFATFFSGALD